MYLQQFTTLNPGDFVDDIMIINKDVKSAVNNGERMSRALKTLSLTANAKKSVVLVIGGNNHKTREVRDEIAENPVKLHGNPISSTHESEPYLGFVLHKDGFKQSVIATVKARTARAWARATQIKNIINHPAMKGFGWLNGGIVLTQATLPAILSYSAEVWPGVPKYVIEGIESSFKKMVYSIFEIPEKTSYSAVLLELGFLRMKHVIAKLQITYMNQIIWEIRGTKCMK